MDYNKIKNELVKKRKGLFEDLSSIDKNISDIEHVIELAVCNASEGYKLYKMLKSNLSKRRIIKNEIDKNNSLIDILKSHDNKMSNRFNKRIYNTKTMSHIFGNIIDNGFKIPNIILSKEV